MAKSSGRSSFLVGIFVATVCFFGSCIAQSSYGGRNAPGYNSGSSRSNYEISADRNSDQIILPPSREGTSQYGGTNIGGGEQYQQMSSYQSSDNGGYRQNRNYIRTPTYYDPLDTLYDDEVPNIRDPSWDDSWQSNGGGASSYTYGSRDSYYDSSQQIYCGNYNTQYERDLCQRDANARWANTVYGINSDRSTDGGFTRGSQSGLPQSSGTGNSYSNRMGSSNQGSRMVSSNQANRMGSPNQVYRTSSYGTYRNGQGQPASGGQSQSSRTGLYRTNAARTPGPPPPYYTGPPRPNDRASPPLSYATSHEYHYQNSSETRHENSSGGNQGGSSQPTYKRPESSQTGSRVWSGTKQSDADQTGSSRPIHATSSQASDTDSSRLVYTDSSKTSSKGSDGSKAGPSSRPLFVSQSSSNGGYAARPTNSRPINVKGSSGPIRATSSQASDRDSSRIAHAGSLKPSSKGSDGRNVGSSSRSVFRSQSSNMGSNGGYAARPTGPRPVNVKGSSRPYYTGPSPADNNDLPYYSGSSQPDYKDLSQFNYTYSPQTHEVVLRPIYRYEPNQVSGYISDQGTYPQTAYGQDSFSGINVGSTNPDSDGLLLAFNEQLKTLYEQFNDIINRLLRFFDQVSHRLAPQDPIQNPPEEFCSEIDDGPLAVQRGRTPSSAFQQLYRRANGIITVCKEYLTRCGVDLSHGSEYETLRPLKGILSSLYLTGLPIIQEIASNTASPQHPFSVQYLTDRTIKLSNFINTLHNLRTLLDRYTNKVNIDQPPRNAYHLDQRTYKK